MKKIACSFLLCLLSMNTVSAQQMEASTTEEAPLETISVTSKFSTKQLVAPSILIATGITASFKWPINHKGSIDKRICHERNETNPRFRTHIDDYIQFSPIALTYAFDAMGMNCKTDFANRTAICLKSHLLMTAIVTTAKTIINTNRPDASGKNSFPSGHTAQAFTAATFMNEELGQRYKWVPYLAYPLASSVGILRVMNNKHYASDVLVGAGVGILATKLVYATHQYKWGKKKEAKTIMI